jgi:hypothetical protein
MDAFAILYYFKKNNYRLYPYTALITGHIGTRW